MIYRLAITGPTGAGKSLFCARLAEHGAAVIDADRLGHMVLDQPEVRAAVAGAFGDDILGADGRIDRAVLGPRVFAADQARQRLDDLVHPPLALACVQELDAAAAGGSPLVILEAAVYFLLPGPPPVDRTVVVTAPAALRRRRLMELGLSEDQADARLMAQAHLEPTWCRADRVIDNVGDQATLLQAADALWREFTAPTTRKG